jgi:hypothetical protein
VWLSHHAPLDDKQSQKIDVPETVLEKMIITQLAKKFLAFYGTRRFTVSRHVPIRPYTNPVRTLARYFLKISVNVNLTSTPRSYNWSFPSGFPTKPLHAFLIYAMRAAFPTHLIFLTFIALRIFSERNE